MNGAPGSKLVFLVSQPRAGSTLVERVLAGHPEVHAAGETWLMLPLLRAMEADPGDGDTILARRALRAFLATLPEGPAAYRSGAARLAEPVYAAAAAAAGKSLFLDKTPRYYRVLAELRAVFPGARFVILLRHPLAVLHSIVETWVRPDWLLLTRFSQDLALAPRLLLQAIDAPGVTVVRYEDFVSQPEPETRRLCAALGLAFHPPMLRYAESFLPRWEMGDQKLYTQTAPVTTSVEAWKAGLADPQSWRLARDYVALLGPEVLAGLGYPSPGIEAVLEKARPSRWRLAATFSLDEALGTRRPGRVASALERFARAWSRRGLRGALLGGLAWARGVRPPPG